MPTAVSLLVPDRVTCGQVPRIHEEDHAARTGDEDHGTDDRDPAARESHVAGLIGPLHG
ncbi:hypothetical protein GCM10010254_62370 [Streptomyces chromofuscus]|nr:hypothetical protein GCM10010254_62370 [Streptomyces chromofuscus]